MPIDEVIARLGVETLWKADLALAVAGVLLVVAAVILQARRNK